MTSRSAKRSNDKNNKIERNAKNRDASQVGFTAKQAEFLLAAVIIARSTSYLFAKIALDTLGPFTLLGERFILAFAVMAVIYRHRLATLTKAQLLYGFLLGLTFFIVMAAEMLGLERTASSITSLLENTAIVIVPLLEAILLRRLPSRVTVTCTTITIVGIVLLTFKGGALTITLGEAFCLLAAFLYACAIIITDRISRRDDPVIMGILQVGFMGMFSLIAALLFETPTLPSTGMEWVSVLVLALVCSAFGFTFQPVAQSKVSAEKTSLFCALNPLSASILGFVFLQEHFGLQELAGAALVIISPIISSRKK